MQINGINGAQPVNPTNQVESAKATQAASITNPTDQVDISTEAELNSQTVELVNQLEIRDLPEIRTDRVAQIREAIEAGTYETQEKLDIAIDRLLDAAEVFLCSTSPCIWPVTKCNGKAIGTLGHETVTALLQRTWSQSVGIDIVAQASMQSE